MVFSFNDRCYNILNNKEKRMSKLIVNANKKGEKINREIYGHFSEQ
jgi:hypothetical protein